MAIVPTKKCDVFGRFKNIKSYAVQIDELDCFGKPIRTLATKKVDLCQQALDRLQRFVIRGTSKPSPDPVEETAEATA